MNNHNLDDLIIGDEHLRKNNKTKGVLTILALLIIVLIIAIVLTKVILKEPKIDAVVIDDSTQMISPDLKLQSTSNSKVEDNKKSSDSTEDTIETITQKEDIQEQQLQKPVVVPESKPKRMQKQMHEVNKPTVKKVIITDEFEQIKPVSKPRVAANPKPVQKPKITQNISQKYYIQVGSYSQEPSGNYLRIIKNSGFNYTVISSAGRKKLLVGPYNSRSAVDSALPTVRDRINKGAFVYKVK